MTLRPGLVLVLNLFSNGDSLLPNAPAHDTQSRSCSGVELIFKWRVPSDECPSSRHTELVLFWC